MSEERTFAGHPSSVRAARAFVARVLADLDPPRLECVVLKVSELEANSVGHADTSFHVAVITSDRGLRIEVTDQGRGSPVLRAMQSCEPSGRGLHIVDNLADTWGVSDHDGAGKTVWFSLAPQGPTGPTGSPG
ncbi:MAG: ATP-binding protein [Acidimicrobiales bacterium]